MPDKPIGVAYIDDKSFNFINNWSEITDKLLENSKNLNEMSTVQLKSILKL